MIPTVITNFFHLRGTRLSSVPHPRKMGQVRRECGDILISVYQPRNSWLGTQPPAVHIRAKPFW